MASRGSTRSKSIAFRTVRSRWRNANTCPLRPELVEAVRAESVWASTLRERAKRVLASVNLSEADWYSETWLDGVLSGLEASLHAACERWRGLYQAADAQRRLQDRILNDNTSVSEERHSARKLRDKLNARKSCLSRREQGAVRLLYISLSRERRVPAGLQLSALATIRLHSGANCDSQRGPFPTTILGNLGIRPARAGLLRRLSLPHKSRHASNLGRIHALRWPSRRCRFALAR